MGVDLIDSMMESIVEGQKQIAEGQRQIVKTQDKQAADIKEIRSTMNEIVKLEERQANHKEAMNRMDQHIGKLQTQVMDLRITSAKTVIKISLIAGIAGAIVGPIILRILDKI